MVLQRCRALLVTRLAMLASITAATAEASLFSQRINLGGATWTDPEGHIWHGDDSSWGGKAWQGRCSDNVTFVHTELEPLVCRYVPAIGSKSFLP